ncbi:MAG: hypothetical protein RR140_01200 [Clostridia bacterium]
MNDFPSETTKLAWQLFKNSGQIQYAMLFIALNNPQLFEETNLMTF